VAPFAALGLAPGPARFACLAAAGYSVRSGAGRRPVAVDAFVVGLGPGTAFRGRGGPGSVRLPGRRWALRAGRDGVAVAMVRSPPVGDRCAVQDWIEEPRPVSAAPGHLNVPRNLGARCGVQGRRGGGAVLGSGGVAVSVR